MVSCRISRFDIVVVGIGGGSINGGEADGRDTEEAGGGLVTRGLMLLLSLSSPLRWDGALCSSRVALFQVNISLTLHNFIHLLKTNETSAFWVLDSLIRSMRQVDKVFDQVKCRIGSV